MDFALGSVGLSVAVISFAWAFGAHRRSPPARWTWVPGASSLFVVADIVLATVGLGYLVAALLAPGRTLAGLTLPLAAATLVAPFLAVLLVPRLVRAAGTAPPLRPAPSLAPANDPAAPLGRAA